MTTKPNDAAGTAEPASPRTVAQVRQDPAYSALFAEAEELFDKAEKCDELAQAFGYFSQAVRIMRTINAAELRTHAAGVTL